MAHHFPEFEATVADVASLRELLSDTSVHYLHLSPRGRVEFQRKDQWQVGEELSLEQVERIGLALALTDPDRTGSVLLEDWRVEGLPSGGALRYVFERRPRGEIAAIARGLIATLEQDLGKGFCGIVLGGPTSRAEELLTYLALTSVTRPVAYVGPVAPVDDAPAEIAHFESPMDPRGRRALGRALRHFPVVMGLEMSDADELALLFSHDGVKGRWAHVVAADVGAALVLLERLCAACPQLDVDVVVGLGPPTENGPSLTHMARRVDGKWMEILAGDRKLVATLKTLFPSADADKKATERPAIPVEIPVEKMGRVSEEFDIASLLNSDDGTLPSIRQSGEIDLQGFMTTKDRIEIYDEEPPTGEFVMDPDAWDADEIENDSEQHLSTNVLRGDRLEQILPVIKSHGDIADLAIGEVRPDQLRQTIESEVDVKALRQELMKAVARGRENTAVEPPPAPPQNGGVEEKTAEIDIPRAWQDLSRPNSPGES